MDNETTTLASNIAKLIDDSKRRLLYQKPTKQTKVVDTQAANLVKTLIPDSNENWPPPQLKKPPQQKEE